MLLLCAVMRCAVVWCGVLWCGVVCCAVLCCAVLLCTALHCIVLYWAGIIIHALTISTFLNGKSFFITIMIFLIVVLD
jgi:hypothetical protein